MTIREDARSAEGLRTGGAPTARAWATVVAAGLVAGLAAWLIGEDLHGRFQHPMLMPAGFPSLDEVRADARARATAETRSVAAAYGSLGLVLGLAMGLAGGFLRGSARPAALAAAFGALAGAVAGAATSWLLMPTFVRLYDPDKEDLLLSIAILCGICAPIGAAAGAAFGLGLGGRRLAARALLGGALGAAAGVLVYEVAGALAFPLAQTIRPISTTDGSRLFGRVAITTLAAAGALWVTTTGPRGGPPDRETKSSG